jgi:isopentenyl diphosphate isomerase/L-lactate dehydrogenase-like FMN-dependent dehydrogenase
VGSKTKVMIDSGIRGGLDILRALALGAQFTFAGRPYLYALGAMGEAGAGHMMDMFMDELKTEYQHVGITKTDQATSVTLRHPTAWPLEATR